MTWQLASFALLALALGAGFAWYERADPSAKVLALVATLAALAALGRVAFAPIPSVKPTTDIVLLSGFALGAAPGFMVGAVAALASNVFFGQGPFTPWQMAGWGAVGLFGAGLARVFGLGLGRWALAAACGLAGLAYGAFLDLHLWVLYAGEHTLAEYGVLAARGLPFNLTHAGANVVFCLAFGPLLVGALLRYRDRLQVTWRPPPVAPRTAGSAAAVLLATVVVGLTLAGAGAPDARAAGSSASATGRAASSAANAQSAADRKAASRAVSFLRAAQNRDGGFGAARGQSSSQLHSGWALMGLAAGRRDPRAVRRSGKSVVDFIVADIGRIRSIADLERTILALRAAGRTARKVRGRDLVSELVRKRRPDGSFGGQVAFTSFGVLALRAAGRGTGDRTVRAAATWVAREQNADGGFNFQGRGGPSGIDDTAAAVQALVAAGRRTTTAVRRGAAFLVAQQNSDGGMPLSPGGESNAQSTAWAVQALVAARRDPDRVRRAGSRTPLAYLRSLQTRSGEVRYSRTSRQTPVWVTAQALTAFGRRPFPVPRVRERTPARARSARTPARSPAKPGDPGFMQDVTILARTLVVLPMG